MFGNVVSAVDLYLNFEQSSLKNQVRHTSKNNFKIDFFSDYTGNKNQVGNRLKNPEFQTGFSQIDFSDIK